MDGYKLASIAGIFTMAASVCVQNSITTMAQVGQPGQPGQTQPGRDWERPSQPGRDWERPAQPGAAAQPQDRLGISTQSMFQLRDPADENKLKDIARELSRIETEMENANQRLTRQLAQARLLDGERKVDAMMEVMQGILQDHAQMHTYLNDLREAVTGRVGTAASVLPIIEPEDDKDDMDDDDDNDPFEEPDDEPDSPTLPPE